MQQPGDTMKKKLNLEYTTLLLALLFALPALALAQVDIQSMSRNNGKAKEKIQYPFDSTDTVESYIGPMKKDLKSTPERPNANHYFVGEPIVVPIVMANHTKYPITLETNFHPRSHVTVMIRPEGQQQFRYNGPYMPGVYAPAQLFLYPLDEYHTQLVIWADFDAPGHLAIDKPGTYTIDISVQIAIDESPVSGNIKPEGGTFTITVDPTPKELEPLVTLFKQDMNLVYLNLHKNPPQWGPQKTLDILNQYPRTVFTPYLRYCLASYYGAQYATKPSDETANNAMINYQLAVLTPWAYWEEAYMDLLALVDKLELGNAAVALSRQMLAKVSEDRLGRIGNLQINSEAFFQKYLVNMEELDPTQYWAFLP